MRILITGASGFIGSHLVQALRHQHDIVACVRHPHTFAQRFTGIAVAQMDFSTHHTEEDWLLLLQDIDVVINTVGIIAESRQQTFEQLHHLAPCILFKACQKAGIEKVIQISALGCDETAFSQYHLSKKAADDYLRQLDLYWAIIKPSLVYGAGGKSAALFKAISMLPVIPVVDTGEQWVQPIHIDGLTNSIVVLLEPEAPVRIDLDAVGPEPMSFKAMLMTYRAWLSISPARFLPIPYSIALIAGKAGGFLGNTPMNADAIQMLKAGNTGDVSTLQETLNISPRSLQDTLTAQSAEEPDRWHARLYFLRPALRIAIGSLWLFTGIVSLGLYPIEQSYALLGGIGITGILAPFALYGAAVLDIGLGIATLLRYRIQWVGGFQISLMLAYSALISVGLSEFWLHPFGPITKNVPLIVATLIMMALEKD